MGFHRRGHFASLIEEEEKKERPRVTSDRKLAVWIIGYLKDHKLQVFFALALIIVSSLIALISPQITRKIVDDAFGNNPPVDGNRQLLLYLTLGLLGVAIVTAIIQILRTITLYKIGFHTIKKIRTDSFDHLQSLSLNYFDTQETGRIISKITNDCDKINELMSGGLITSLTDLLTLIGIMVVLLVMNWELALWCFLFSIPPVLIISWLFKVRARKAYRKTRKTIAVVTANLSESISGVKVSKSFVREEKNIEEFKRVNLANREANLKAVAVFATTFPIFHFINAAVVAFVYFYSGWTLNVPTTMHFAVSIGTAVAFTQYIGNFFRPILNLTMFYNTFQSTMAATERIYELLHTEPSVIEKENAYALPEINGRVKFKDVVFGYKENELVLNHFDLEVQPGEAIAIVGPTGAGKTTIINLLARFYEIQNGEITIDGHNIQDVTLNSLHSQMGIVLQDPYLFSGNIRENITYGSGENISLDEIETVVKTVNAHEFIQRMPKGYDSPVGERGSRLSLGQRQLISFARALIGNPKILILDEATSSVDPYTEVLIKNALEHLLADRTSFIIAHRLSTVRNADRIIVIKDGKIVEEGSNEELLKKQGEYYRLYQLQFKEQEEVLTEEKVRDSDEDSTTVVTK